MNVVTIFCIFDHCHCSEFPDFTQVFHITARKFLVLAKYFLVISQKNYDFFKFLKPVGRGEIAALLPGKYGYGNIVLFSEDWKQ